MRQDILAGENEASVPEEGRFRTGTFPEGGSWVPTFPSRRQFLLWGLLFLLCIFIAPSEAVGSGTASLQKIRYWYTPEYTRVVLDLDQSVKYHVGRLGADRSARLPERLYLDLFRTNCARDLPEKIVLDEGPVHFIRASHFRKNTGRLVLYLRQAEQYKVFCLDEPDRIVIDLWWSEKDAEERNPPPSRQGKRERKASRLPLIVLDPGHGGSDPGAIGRRGLREKDVVLTIARDLKRVLEERGTARVVLTRNGDTSLSLRERTRIANSRNADLFISIHANANSHRKVRGIETYYLDNTTDKASIRLAKLENKSAGDEIDDLHCILRVLRLSSNANVSNILAQTVQKSLTRNLRDKYKGIEDLGAKGNLFFVLIGAHMPSVLVEVSFISNPAEEKRLKNAAYRRTVSRGIAKGIEAYLDQPSLHRLVAGPPGGIR